MINLKSLCLFAFLILSAQQAAGQIHGVVIGDTDLVAQYDLLDIVKDWTFYTLCFDPNSDSISVGWYFPNDFETSPFQWYCRSINEKNCLHHADVYFAPKTIDTILSWRKFVFIPNHIERGCPGVDSIRIYEYGYGIKPDSLILIRPKIINVTLPYDSIQLANTGSFSLLLTNNTAANVTIKQIELQIDSSSHVLIESIKDSLGNYPAAIAPEIHKQPIQIKLKSTITPLNIDREYVGSLLFHLSRLGIDSVHSSIANIKIPARQQSKVDVAKNPSAFSISPNPCTDKITVTLDKNFKEPLTFAIYDLLGRKVMENKIASESNASSFTIQLPLLHDGSYVLVCSDQRQKFVGRFVVLKK